MRPMDESEIQELAESPREIGAARGKSHLRLILNVACILVILWLARDWLLRVIQWLDGHFQKEIARRLGISSGAIGFLYFLVHTVWPIFHANNEEEAEARRRRRRNNSIRAITPSRNGIRRAGAMSGITIEPATRQLELLRSGEISVAELAEAHIQQIERLNPQLNAFADFDAERVRERARKHDAWRGTRSRRPLFGLPVTVKSSIATRGFKCEIGSLLHEGRCAARRRCGGGAAARGGGADSGHDQLPGVSDGLRDGESAAWAHE